MSNSFYTHGSFPSTGAAATSASMRNELDLITQGFDKLPTLGGSYSNQVVVLSATGLAMTTSTSLNGISIGTTTAAAGAFTTLSASSTVSGTGFSTYLASPPAIGGTAAAAITGTTITANTGFSGALNGTVGATTPASGAFTSLSASGTVSGTGFSTYLASPPAIGGTTASTVRGTTITATTAFAGALNGTVGATTPSTGAFTTLSASSTVSGTGFSTYLASPPAIGDMAAAAGTFTTLSSTGNTTLGDATTDTVTVNGYMGVGGAGGATTGIRISSAALNGGTQIGIQSLPVGTSAATTQVQGVGSQPGTAAATFTCAATYAFRANDAVKGAGSTITDQHGVYVDDQTNGTNNYGIRLAVSSGTNKWNVYASGTADNYFAGKVGIGTTSPAVTFAVSATDAILLPAGTTAQRPTGATGYIRFNSSLNQFEGYGASAWGSIGGGATGASGEQVFWENDTSIDASYTITSNKNAGTFGPVTVATGVTVTVPTGSVWTIV